MLVKVGPGARVASPDKQQAEWGRGLKLSLVITGSPNYLIDYMWHPLSIHKLKYHDQCTHVYDSLGIKTIYIYILYRIHNIAMNLFISSFLPALWWHEI